MNSLSSRDTPMPNQKLSALLMDNNAERRALRTRIMGLHGLEVIGAGDLTEAGLIWHRDRYDIVLMDIRADHRGCIALRNEIKKEKPAQIVAFLVGGPKFIELEPLADSYVDEDHGSGWGASLRRAVRDSCNVLPQRNGFVEAGFRIALARKAKGDQSPKPREPENLAVLALEPIGVASTTAEPDDGASEAPPARPDIEFQW